MPSPTTEVAPVPPWGLRVEVFTLGFPRGAFPEELINYPLWDEGFLGHGIFDSKLVSVRVGLSSSSFDLCQG